MPEYMTLPADLPADWETGDIVAPYGAEVELSERHGYNYLMEQVNSAQRACNLLNGFIEDHRDDDAAHSELFNAIAAKISALETRMARAEDALFNDVTGNPFQMAFDTLEGKNVTGVWNKPQQRIEC